VKHFPESTFPRKHISPSNFSPNYSFPILPDTYSELKIRGNKIRGNVARGNEIWGNVTRRNEIQGNVIRRNEIQKNLTRGDEIRINVTLGNDIRGNVTRENEFGRNGPRRNGPEEMKYGELVRGETIIRGNVSNPFFYFKFFLIFQRDCF
jgi:hypothetical protein